MFDIKITSLKKHIIDLKMKYFAEQYRLLCKNLIFFI